MTMTLYTPTRDELDYRIRLLADADTMAYNAPWSEDGTGRIFLTTKQVQEWYDHLAETNMYYAYVMVDDQPIGDVNIHSNGGIGMVLEAQHRGKGYGKKALQLLCDKAFGELGFEVLTDEFDAERTDAEALFKRVGFERVGPATVRLTRKRYEKFIKEEQPMSNPRGIIIFGASGSGTTTLGRALAAALRFAHFDLDDFFWVETDVPFTEVLPVEERITRLQAALAGCDRFVLSGSMLGWSEPFVSLLDLAIFVYTPTDIRIERLKKREREDFGERILEGGDMHTVFHDFIEWSATYDAGDRNGRSLARHEEWIKTLPCPVLRVDGARAIEENIERCKGALT